MLADSAGQEDAEDLTVIPEEAPVAHPKRGKGRVMLDMARLDSPLNPERIGPLLFKFVNVTHTRARVYDRAGDLLVDSQA